MSLTIGQGTYSHDHGSIDPPCDTGARVATDFNHKLGWFSLSNFNWFWFHVNWWWIFHFGFFHFSFIQMGRSVEVKDLKSLNFISPDAWISVRDKWILLYLLQFSSISWRRSAPSPGSWVSAMIDCWPLHLMVAWVTSVPWALVARHSYTPESSG